MATFEVISAAAIGGGGSSVAGYTSGTLIYVALLTQTGTNAPVATVLQNTLGGTVVWTRNAEGDYRGTLSGVFTANKTWLLANVNNNNDIAVSSLPSSFLRTSNDVVSLQTANGADLIDSVLSSTSIQILVYP
tara:strand:+ start:788 stop:1186 length:399 start_codon:yes stop_codon:yes gene_type:complete